MALLSAVRLCAEAPPFEWAISAGGSGSDLAYGVAVDVMANIYVTGSFQGSAWFGATEVTTSAVSADMFLAKYDRAGSLLWVKQGRASQYAVGRSVAVDAAGDIYVAGHFGAGTVDFGGDPLTSAGNWDVFLVKFAADGRLLWARRGGGGHHDYGHSVAVDLHGNCHVAGSFFGLAAFGEFLFESTDDYDVFHANFDADGNILWVVAEGGRGYDSGFGVAADWSGNVCIVGYFAKSAAFGSIPVIGLGWYDAFIAQYAGAASVLWVNHAGSISGGYNFAGAYGVTADPAGNFYVTGTFQSTTRFGQTNLTSAGGTDCFVAQYDGAGNTRWARRVGGALDDERGNAIAADAAGNCHVTGRFYGTATLDTASLVSSGGSDIFIARYDTFGNLAWAKKVGSPGQDDGTAIALDNRGNAYVAGHFYGAAAFDGIQLQGRGREDLFITKLVVSRPVPPTLYLQPQSQTVLGGSNATFAVAAVGSPPLAYQWQLNGADLPAATNSDLAIAHAQHADEGDYRVVVSNPGGAITSQVARLTVRYRLTVQSNGEGDVGREPDLPLYAFGTTVILTPGPGRWYAFAHWTDGSAADPRVITIGTNNRYTAVFSPVTPVETLTFGEVSRTAPQGMPAILVDGEFVPEGEVLRFGSARIEMLTTFSNGAMLFTLNGSTPNFFSSLYGGPFELRRTATIRAAAWDALLLESWETDPVLVTVEPLFTLSATTAGGGTIDITPLAAEYPPDTLVSLVARPEPGWTFLHWLGDAADINPTTVVRMTGRRCVQAVFGTPLTASVSGSGTVVMKPAATVYPFGTVVRIAGVPGPGHGFAFWANATSSTNNPLNFEVTTPHPGLTAAFAPLPVGQATLAALSDGLGEVAMTPQANRFSVGSVVTLRAIANADQQFLGWSGDANGTENPLSVVMTRSKVVTAQFTRRPRLSFPPCLDTTSGEDLPVWLTGDWGAVYHIDSAPDAAGPWTLWATTKNVWGTTQFLVPGAAHGPQRFYRAMTE